MTAVTRAGVSVYTVPTDGPEPDGTFEWTSTTIIIVEGAAAHVTREDRLSLSGVSERIGTAGL